QLPGVNFRNPLSNPLQILWQFRALQQFVSGPVSSLIGQIVKDPRHLRKYFSIAGVARLAVDLYTSGVKTAVEAQMIAEMTARGFLASAKRRQAGANWMATILAAATVVPVALSIGMLNFD